MVEVAHFAQVVDGRVVSVIVVDNKDCGGGGFPESESIGQDFISLQGLGEGWLQTSYNGSFRRRFAPSGGFYDFEGEAFYPASPGSNWSLDTETWQWVNPSGNKLPND